jgi:hypothetical protein
MECAFVGIHETPAENADAIIANGFTIPTERGRTSWLGTGLYFWESDLALGHWFAEHRRHSEYAIFKAQIRVQAERFLDLASLDARSKLQERALELNAAVADPRLAPASDSGALVDAISDHLGAPYDAVRGIYEGAFLDRPMPELFNRPKILVDVKLILAVRSRVCLGPPVLVFRGRR